MPRKLIIGRWFAAPLLVGALMLTACGSDDNTNATPSAETTATTAAAETSETPAYEEFCTALADYTQNPDNPDEEADPAELERVVSVAPQEISEEMQDLLEMSVQISEFDLEAASEEDMAEFEAVLESFGPVAARMEAWAVANCPDVESG